jgi:hypothetical protein
MPSAPGIWTSSATRSGAAALERVPEVERVAARGHLVAGSAQRGGDDLEAHRVVVDRQDAREIPGPVGGEGGELGDDRLGAQLGADQPTRPGADQREAIGPVLDQRRDVGVHEAFDRLRHVADTGPEQDDIRLLGLGHRGGGRGDRSRRAECSRDRDLPVAALGGTQNLPRARAGQAGEKDSQPRRRLRGRRGRAAFDGAAQRQHAVRELRRGGRIGHRRECGLEVTRQHGAGRDSERAERAREPVRLPPRGIALGVIERAGEQRRNRVLDRRDPAQQRFRCRRPRRRDGLCGLPVRHLARMLPA